MVPRTSENSELVTQEVLAEIELTKGCFREDTLISPGFSFVINRGFSQTEASLVELREVLKSGVSESSNP